MAYDSPQGIKLTGILAGADLSAAQYSFVKLDSAGDAVLASTQGEKAVGVLQNKPTSGLPCEIIAVGVTKLKTDGTAHAPGEVLTPAVTTGTADAAASADFVLGSQTSRNEKPSILNG